MRLVAGFCPDPLGIYSAPPDSQAVIMGREKEGGGRKGLGIERGGRRGNGRT